MEKEFDYAYGSVGHHGLPDMVETRSNVALGTLPRIADVQKTATEEM